MYAWQIFLFWLLMSVVVGVAANARGRDGVGWFVLSALLLSPVIGLLLVLVMKPLTKQPTAAAAAAPSGPFEPDSIYEGIPYRVQRDGTVEAIMQGARVRFADFGKFSALTGAPPSAPPALPIAPPLSLLPKSTRLEMEQMNLRRREERANAPAISPSASNPSPNWDKNPWVWVVLVGLIAIAAIVSYWPK